MTQIKPASQNLLLPLRKLVKIRYRHGHVRIKTEMLRCIDLTLLENFLHFDLAHHFGARVELTKCPCIDHLEVKVTVATKATEWPQPNEQFADLYCKALGTAARIAFVDGEMGGAYWTSVYRQSTSVVVQAAFPLKTSGETILTTLEHQLVRTKKELFKVLGVIAGGPKPGSSRLTDED